MAPYRGTTGHALPPGTPDNDVSASEAMFEPLAMYFGARRDPAWPHEEAPSPTAAFLVQEPRWGMDPGSPESLMRHQTSDFRLQFIDFHSTNHGLGASMATLHSCTYKTRPPVNFLVCILPCCSA